MRHHWQVMWLLYNPFSRERKVQMKPDSSPQQLNEHILHLEQEVARLQSELAVLRSQKLVEALLNSDAPPTRENKTVTRTERGLVIKGTRLTLYAIMDEIANGKSLKDIRDIYELTDAEMLDVLDYIHLNKEAVEEEYREVLQSAEENRKYWEGRNRELTKQNYQQLETVRAKLQEWREQYRTDDKS